MLSKSYIGIVIGLYLVLIGYADVQAKDQIVTPEPGSISVAPGEELTFSVKYDVSDGDNELIGIGVRLHYDSRILEFVGADKVFGKGSLGVTSPQDDIGNQDGDDNTDKIIIGAWMDLTNVGWPGEALPLGLFDAKFKVGDSASACNTHINFSASSTAPSHSFSSNSLCVAIDGLPVLIPHVDIKINNQDGPVTLHQSDILSLSIALNNNGHTDEADWWLAATTPIGLFFFTSEGWKTDLCPAYQGPLFYFDLVPLFKDSSLSGLGLPTEPGAYAFYFGVDTVKDGEISVDNLSFDYIEMNIEP